MEIGEAAQAGIIYSLKEGISAALERRRKLGREVSIIVMHPSLAVTCAEAAKMSFEDYIVDLMETFKCHIGLTDLAGVRFNTVRFIGPDNNDEGMIELHPQQKPEKLH